MHSVLHTALLSLVMDASTATRLTATSRTESRNDFIIFIILVPAALL